MTMGSFQVSIINATAADFDMWYKDGRSDTSLNGVPTARLLGFLRTPDSWTLSKETLRMCASFSQATLSLSSNKSYPKVRTPDICLEYSNGTHV